MAQMIISSMTAKWMARDLNRDENVKTHLKCLLEAEINEVTFKMSGLDQAVVRLADNDKYARRVRKVIQKYPAMFASMEKKETKKKEIRVMLTACTASWIARDLNSNTNCKSHLKQLFKADITAEALVKSGLEMALTRHLSQAKYSDQFQIKIQELLKKYATISAKEREIHQQQMNQLMENRENYFRKEICPISMLFQTKNPKSWTPPSYDNHCDKIMSELPHGFLVHTRKRPSQLAEIDNEQPTAKVPAISDEEKELLEEEIGGY